MASKSEHYRNMVTGGYMRRLGWSGVLLLGIGLGLSGCGFLLGIMGDPMPEEKEISAEKESFSLLDFTQIYDREKLVEWKTGPSVGKNASNELLLTFIKKDGTAPTSVGRLQFKLWMSIHGHGSPKNGKVDPLLHDIDDAHPNPHIYSVSEFVFTMGGPWELEVSVVLEGKTYALSIPVHVPES